MRGRVRCFAHCGSRGGTRMLTWRAMGRNAVKGTSPAVVSDCCSVPCRQGHACEGESRRMMVTLMVTLEEFDTPRPSRNQDQTIPAGVQSSLLMDNRVFTGSRHENSRAASVAIEAM